MPAKHQAARLYLGLAGVAATWTIGNCIYVYLVLGGEKTYRIETGAIILVALLLPLAVSQAYRLRPPAQNTNLFRAGVVACLALWLATYAPLLTYPFLSDDYVFLDLYRHFGRIVEAPQFFRPFFALVVWAVSSVSPGSPWLFHALSFGLHLTSACLLYALVDRLVQSKPLAFASFAVFLLNPLQLEAVLWMSGLQELLWTSSVLASLFVYVGRRTLTLARLTLTCGLLILGLLSKEAAVSFVLLLPAADWAFYRFERGKLLPVGYGVFAVLLAGYLFLRSWFVPLEAGYLLEPTRMMLKQLVTTPYRFFAQPWNESAVAVPAVIACGTAVAPLALLFWTVGLRRSGGSAIVAGAYVILATTVPVYSYFFVREDLLSSRYIYFASAGWSLIAATLLSSVARSGSAFLVMTLGLALCLNILLNYNLRPWRVAGEVVHVMQAAIQRGDVPTENLAEWEARAGLRLRYRNGIPYEYQGVGLFINGYEQFQRHTQESLLRRGG